ncbi:MAG: Hsp20/alpha crystallin family protein [Chitinophagaceae bacterium]|nr:MAG: Hsp20/alpha crystallin family protein [Chitinophagaceae bacterium]
MKLVRTNDNVAALRPFGALVDDFINGPLGKWIDDDLRKSNLFNAFPPVNIRETKDAYELDLVAPGLEKTDFKINLEGNTLFIAFEQKEEKKDESEKHIRKEYSYRSFKRAFSVDDDIDTSRIDAKYENGILKVSLLKKEETVQQNKEISVN